MTKIITRIPPAWFVHIEEDDGGFPVWINLANVSSVSGYQNGIVIRLLDQTAYTLSGNQKDQFLEEIKQLNARYQLTTGEEEV